MKNIQINTQSIGQTSYNLVEKVGQNIGIFEKISIGISASESGPGDYCFYDKQQNKVIIIPNSTDLSLLSTDNYVPIGVVVVPGKHNVYGDGSCGVMSLKEMNCDTPSTGGTSEYYMYWGEYNVDIPDLLYFNEVPIGNTSDGIPTESNKEGYLPSDRFSLIQCLHDTDAYYNQYTLSPSPYFTDGSRNPGYYQITSPLSSANALSDFDGIGNTNKMISKRGTKDYSSWIPNRETEEDYPAASCCNMFYTEGTSQGDWYLPAIGELGYIMPPFNKINTAIDNIIQTYGSSIGIKLNDYHYWSSTQQTSGRAWYIDPSQGHARWDIKDDDVNVRAFIRIK